MHEPVLLYESIDALCIQKVGVYIDCTVNRGGHSKAILQKLPSGSSLICIDLDGEALLEAKQNLASLANESGINIYFYHKNFRYLESILEELGIEKVDGILADLGVSSQEIGQSGRGFSFLYDEPLAMTLNDRPSEGDVTAKDVVNDWSYETLSSILYSFSDERYANRIAHRIVKEREKSPITTTFELIEIIKSAVPKSYLFGKTHVATKTFQAIRMAVNDELGAITALFNASVKVLHQKGRLAIITFHSTEDRLVKHEGRKYENELSFVNKKAIMPSEEELLRNKRARSAQLRIFERK
jgi:16S rRNA (cytosine1402-N4)-methyltransferase